MVRIPVVPITPGFSGGSICALISSTCSCGAICIGNGRGPQRLFYKFQLFHRYKDVTLSHSEKATYANHNATDFSGTIDDKLVNVAELLVLFIINIDSDKFRSSP